MNNQEDDTTGAKVISLEEYRNKTQNPNPTLEDTLDKLEEMVEVVYSTYSEEEQLGYERFKRLIEIIQQQQANEVDDDNEEEE